MYFGCKESDLPYTDSGRKGGGESLCRLFYRLMPLLCGTVKESPAHKGSERQDKLKKQSLE